MYIYKINISTISSSFFLFGNTLFYSWTAVQDTYDGVVNLLKNKDFDGLYKAFRERNQLHVPYWICAFSVNQHAGICGRAPKVDSTGVEITSCCCATPKHFDGDFSEMNKFDDMMAFLKKRLRQDGQAQA